MTCREFVDFLMDYLDGSLPAPARQEFETHLNACPPCVSFLKTYEASIKLGKKACEHLDEPVPAHVPEQLVRAIMAARAKQE